jgi:8-oxo-dGTP pyrophosphatase MutT (NUDIX family)
MNKNIHITQLEILKKALFAPKSRFSELKPSDIESNQFSFHLNELVDAGLIIKNKDGFYSLTNKGKETANTIDTDHNRIVKQAKISAWIACSRNITDETEYLIFTRLKHPFYGCKGFISGKVLYGENTSETAQRELLEESGLTGTPELIQITHFIVINLETSEVVEDKFMFMYHFKNPTGKLKESGEEGKYEWVKESNLSTYVDKHYESVQDFLNQVNDIKEFNGNIKYTETHLITENF